MCGMLTSLPSCGSLSQHDSTNCPSCVSRFPVLRFDPPPSEGELCSEMEVFRKYVPRPHLILKVAGRVTVDVVFVHPFVEQIWAVMIDGYGPAFLLHQDPWGPIPGESVVFFNGHVVGLLLGKPVLATPVCPFGESTSQELVSCWMRYTP